MTPPQAAGIRDAGRLCKVWEEDEASGRPGGVRGPAGLSGGGGSAASGRPPARGRRVRRTSAPPPPPPPTPSSPPPPPPQEPLTGEAGGGRPGPGGALTAPSEEEVCALAAPESQTQKLPAWSRLQNPLWGGRGTWRGPAASPPRAPQPRAGTDFEGGRGGGRCLVPRRLPPPPSAPPRPSPHGPRAPLAPRGASGPAALAVGAGSARLGAAPPSPALLGARRSPSAAATAGPEDARLGGRRSPASSRNRHLRTSSEAAAGILASRPGI
ncbi:formin-like protein 20 [Oryx dammah]|uniref:formin-like protein 20 n=1 Tax=Oryx dammah TaxID=59534 RepID=UPI001A9C18D8|nr:formin-like protein 20 [Oryx dammah]